MTTQLLKKTLLTTGLISLLSLGAQQAVAGDENHDNRIYIDPVTGEEKVAAKLLSEMTDAEKALLSNEEYQALKDLEAKLKAAQEAAQGQ